jgi:hypothetical protein
MAKAQLQWLGPSLARKTLDEARPKMKEGCIRWMLQALCKR